MKPLILILRLALATGQATPEFGDISEIAGMTRVYVYSGDLKSRERIIKELKKEPLFEIVGEKSKAEFSIYYGWQGVTTWSIAGVRTNAYKGDLVVYVGSRNRIVWSTQAGRKTTLSKNPADKVVERFIKDYKTARATLKPLDPPFGVYEKKP